MSNELSPTTRQDALVSIIQRISHRGAQVVMYTSALGAIALIPRADLPLEFVAAGVGVNILSSLIERVARKEEVESAELEAAIDRAITLSKIDKLLTEDDFFRSISRVIHQQDRLLSLMKGYEFEAGRISGRLQDLYRAVEYQTSLSQQAQERTDDIGQVLLGATYTLEELLESEKEARESLFRIEQQLTQQSYAPFHTQDEKQAKMFVSLWENWLKISRAGMLTDRLSWQQTTQKYFVGRESINRDLIQWLADTKTEYWYHIFGIGGIGKSWLLQKTCLRYLAAEAIVVYLPSSSRQSLSRIVKDFTLQLENQGIQLRNTKEVLLRHEHVLYKLRSVASDDTEIYGDLVSLDEEAEEIRGGAQNRLYNPASRVLRPEEIDLSTNIIQLLDDALIKDLNSVPRSRHVLLALDAFRFEPGIANWLKLICMQQPGLFKVLTASRQDLPISIALIGFVISRELHPLDLAETEQLIALQKSEHSQIDATPDDKLLRMINLSKGIPLIVSWLLDIIRRFGIRHFDVGQIRVFDQLVDYMLDETPLEHRQILEVCSILRRFNFDTLEFFFPEEDTRILFDQVKSYSFVQYGVDGLSLHEVIRELITNRIAWRSQSVLDEIHGKAVVFYDRNVSRETPFTSRWQSDQIEYLFHLHFLDDKRAVKEVKELFLEAERTAQLDFASLLLDELNSNDLNPLYGPWIDYARGRLAFWMKGEKEALEILEGLLNDQELRRYPSVMTDVLLTIARAHQRIGEIDEAVSMANRAREIARLSGSREDELMTLGPILDILSWAGRESDAAKLAEEIVPDWEEITQKDDAKAYVEVLLRLGILYRRIGQPVESLKALQKAESISTQAGNPYLSSQIQIAIGDVSRDLGDFEESIEWYEKSLQTMEVLGGMESINLDVRTLYAMADYAIGRLKLMLGLADEALNHFKRAVTTLDSNSMYGLSIALGLKGIGNLVLGRNEDCEKDLLEALDVANKLGVLRVIVTNQALLSEFHFLNGNEEKGQEYSLRARELARSDDLRRRVVEVGLRLGDALIRNGRPQAASEVWLRTYEIRDTMGLDEESRRLLIQLENRVRKIRNE